jgi:hypothetical protein
MIKKILFIYYSQSGQLGDIIDRFSEAFEQSDFLIEKVRVFPEKEFCFPWNMDDFFETMPECVQGIPLSLKPFELKEAKYDLVVFGYQPWFLSPSLPATSILESPQFQKAVKNTPVVTIIGARNMWLSSQERIKAILKEKDTTLVGNIVLVDRHNNLTSLVTILYWMLTAKRDRYLGIFPRPGVSDEDISRTFEFGNIVKNCLITSNWTELQPELIKSGALEVKPNLMFIETKGAKLFKIWAGFITKRKNRTPWLRVFKYYLLIALFIVAPLVLIINIIIFRPFLLKTIKRKKDYYLSINQKSWKT